MGPVYTTMRETKRVFKNKLKWCQENREQIKINIIATCHEKKEQKERRSEQQFHPPASVEGISVSASIADLFKQYFSVKSPLVDSENESLSGKGTAPETVVTVTASVLKNMKRGKPPGHDSLSIEHLQ